MTAETRKKEKPILPKLLASLLALAAMGASILIQADPMTTLIRGGVAFGAGLAFGSIWLTVTSFRVPIVFEPESESMDDSSSTDVAAEAA